MIHVFFSNIRSKIISELKKSKTSIHAAIYWFTNIEIYRVLIEKLQLGVRIELVLHNDCMNFNDLALNFQEFIDLGGELHFSDETNPMHNKFCVIDNNVVINGSYNWTNFAETKNKENITIIEDEPEIALRFISEFLKLKEMYPETKDIANLSSPSKLLRNVPDYLQEIIINDLLSESNYVHRKSILIKALKVFPQSHALQNVAIEQQLVETKFIQSSIGITVTDDRSFTLIPRGSRLPYRTVTSVFNSIDYQDSCRTEIFYGESERASSNAILGVLLIKNMVPRPAATSRLEILSSLDIYGNLKIRMTSIENGQSNSFEAAIDKLVMAVPPPPRAKHNIKLDVPPPPPM